MTAPTVTGLELAAVAALVGFGLQPRMRPLDNPRYRELLQRCRCERPFRSAVEACAEGLEMDLIEVHPVEGLILHPRHGSIFTYRLTDHEKLSSKERLTLGLVHVAIAARAYPYPEDLEEDGAKRIAVDDVDAFLRHLIGKLQEATRDSEGLALPHTGLDAAWRIYAKLTPGRPTAGGSRVVRASSQYWIAYALRWLVEQGMATPAPAHGPGHYLLAHRFRLQVREAASAPAFALLGDLRRTQLVEED
ncbi:hypothetical protein ACFRAR_12280 [Kitasatospora sp. NPDC056651]|uniref:hypothetical protein n=1 Tax=Kitasatospora sp. NPDC056651 TaxID=3345892 RepID=UPI003699FFCB